MTTVLNYLLTYEKLCLSNIYFLATKVVNVLNAFLLMIFPYVTCYVNFHMFRHLKNTRSSMDSTDTAGKHIGYVKKEHPQLS